MTLQDEIRDMRENSMGWMVQRLATQVNRAMAGRLAEEGLAMSEFATMMTVLEQPGLTQAEIGKQFSMPPYAISRALDALEDRGLVERRPHPTSRRAHRIVPTEAGEGLAPRLRAIVRDVNTALTADLSDRKTRQVAEGLRTMLKEG